MTPWSRNRSFSHFFKYRLLFICFERNLIIQHLPRTDHRCLLSRTQISATGHSLHSGTTLRRLGNRFEAVLQGRSAAMASATIPNQMRAIQIKEFNAPYTVSEVPVPTPKPHQVLVQIKAGGFCHTDCMVLENAFGSKLPFIGSHEPAGVIVRMGSDVKEFKEGDRVGCICFDSCCGGASQKFHWAGKGLTCWKL